MADLFFQDDNNPDINKFNLDPLDLQIQKSLPCPTALPKKFNLEWQCSECENINQAGIQFCEVCGEPPSQEAIANALENSKNKYEKFYCE